MTQGTNAHSEHMLQGGHKGNGHYSQLAGPGPKKRKWLTSKKGQQGTACQLVHKIYVQARKSSRSSQSKGHRPQWWGYQSVVEPILLSKMVAILLLDMRILHVEILTREKQAILLGDREHLIFMVQLPTCFNFIDEFPTDKFYLHFKVIFKMFHLFQLNASLLCLWALHLTRAISLDKVQNVAVVDRYHMHKNNLHTP